MRPVGPAPTISTSAELGRDMGVLGSDLNAEKSCFGSHVYVQLGEKPTPAILRLNLKASCLPIYGCRIGMSCRASEGNGRAVAGSVLLLPLGLWCGDTAVGDRRDGREVDCSGLDRV